MLELELGEERRLGPPLVGRASHADLSPVPAVGEQRVESVRTLPHELGDVVGLDLGVVLVLRVAGGQLLVAHPNPVQLGLVDAVRGGEQRGAPDRQLELEGAAQAVRRSAAGRSRLGGRRHPGGSPGRRELLHLPSQPTSALVRNEACRHGRDHGARCRAGSSSPSLPLSRTLPRPRSPADVVLLTCRRSAPRSPSSAPGRPGCCSRTCWPARTSSRWWSRAALRSTSRHGSGPASSSSRRWTCCARSGWPVGSSVRATSTAASTCSGRASGTTSTSST